MIKLENVVKSYSGTVALSGINLNIEPGQIHGILGPNGSGKTTMLKLISAILRPTSGNVTVNDLNTVNDSARIKEIIGYVPETPALYESMSVMERGGPCRLFQGCRSQQGGSDIHLQKVSG